MRNREDYRENYISFNDNVTIFDCKEVFLDVINEALEKASYSYFDNSEKEKHLVKFYRKNVNDFDVCGYGFLHYDDKNKSCISPICAKEIKNSGKLKNILVSFDIPSFEIDNNVNYKIVKFSDWNNDYFENNEIDDFYDKDLNDLDFYKKLTKFVQSKKYFDENFKVKKDNHFRYHIEDDYDILSNANIDNKGRFYVWYDVSDEDNYNENQIRCLLNVTVSEHCRSIGDHYEDLRTNSY